MRKHKQVKWKKIVYSLDEMGIIEQWADNLTANYGMTALDDFKEAAYFSYAASFYQNPN